MLPISKRIILASRSPRRQALLKQIGLRFEVMESGVDEDLKDSLPPARHVELLSLRKAEAIAGGLKEALVIGADTIVVHGDTILGKPADAADARRMLMRLSGDEHTVYTGFTILDMPSQRTITDHEITTVRFRSLSEAEINEYVASGSPMDKAGAYGIQDDYGAVFVERIDGCFYNVVGFPLTKFYIRLLELHRTIGLC